MVEKAFHKSEELVALQTRHRRRMEKERWKTPYESGDLAGLKPSEQWAEFGARWTSPDKSRIKVTHSNKGTAQGKAEELALQVDIDRAIASQRNAQRDPLTGQFYSPNASSAPAMPLGGEATPLRLNPLAELPQSVGVEYNPGCKRVITVGSGVHVIGTPHYGVANGMESRGAYGKGDLFGGMKTGSAPSGEGLDDIFEQEKVVLLAEFDWKAAKGKKKEAARAELFHAKRKLQEMQNRRTNSGLMHAARTFESFQGKSSKTKAAGEKIKSEHGRIDYK